MTIDVDNELEFWTTNMDRAYIRTKSQMRLAEPTTPSAHRAAWCEELAPQQTTACMLVLVHEAHQH
eukprot:422288-Pyramimonas_sp.AAC.1